MVSVERKEGTMINIIFTVTKNLIITLAAAFILWVFLSWGDIVAHNDPVSGSHNYAPLNAFVLLIENYQ